MESTNVDNLIRLYESGMSCRQVGNQIGMHQSVVGKKLRRAGIQLRSRREAVNLVLWKERPVDLVDRYLNGASCDEIGRDCGVKGDTIRRWLVEVGIAIRTKTEATRLAKCKECPPDLIERYLAGESLKSLADAYGLNRGGIDRSGPQAGKASGLVRMLIENGVPIRGRSAAETLKWSRMSEAQRARQAWEAHKARCSPDEVALILALNERGLAIQHQAEVGPYNVDLAMHGCPVAMELQRVWPLSDKVTASYRQRFKNILDFGYAILYVVGPLTDAATVAEQVIALAQLISRKKTFRGGHRVIRGDGQSCSGPCPEFDGLPVI